MTGYPGVLALCLLAFALGEPMRAHSDALSNAAAPLGILSLQFACTAGAVADILVSWNPASMHHARLSLLWDCGFAPTYGAALALLTERLTAPSRPFGRRPATWLPWLPIWAAGADLAENLLHLALLPGSEPDRHAVLAPLACTCALAKWGMLVLWLGTLLRLGLRGLLARTRP